MKNIYFFFNYILTTHKHRSLRWFLFNIANRISEVNKNNKMLMVRNKVADRVTLIAA